MKRARHLPGSSGVLAFVTAGLLAISLGCASAPTNETAKKPVGEKISSAPKSGGSTQKASSSKGSTPASEKAAVGAPSFSRTKETTTALAPGGENPDSVEARRQRKVIEDIEKLNARWAQEKPEQAVQIRFHSLRSGALVVVLFQKTVDANELARRGVAVGSDALETVAPMRAEQVKQEVEKQLRAISGVRDVLIVEK